MITVPNTNTLIIRENSGENGFQVVKLSAKSAMKAMNLIRRVNANKLSFHKKMTTVLSISTSMPKENSIVNGSTDAELYAKNVNKAMNSTIKTNVRKLSFHRMTTVQNTNTSILRVNNTKSCSIIVKSFVKNVMKATNSMTKECVSK